MKGYDFFEECNLDLVDFTDKRSICKFLIETMARRCSTMFEYDGLPDTIPQNVFELGIQGNGYRVVIEVDGKHYQMYGGLGGKLDYNYRPKTFTVSNPYLKNVKSTYTVGEDCVVFMNDSLYRGLLPIHKYYASLLVENVISKRIMTINSRALNVFIAPDEPTKRDCEDFQSELEKGKTKTILDKGWRDRVQTMPYGISTSSQPLSQLIEDQQYIKASWFNEIGLQSNYNMKRESINSNESQLNEDMLLPLIDDMLRCRELACSQLNKMFGLNVSVKLSSSWKAMKSDVMTEPKNNEGVKENVQQKTETD